MKTIDVVKDDIKERKNLDVYITFSVCVFVIILNITGVISQHIVSSAILAVLMTLSISILTNRRVKENRDDLFKRVKDLSNRMYKLGLSDIEPVRSFSEGFNKLIDKDRVYDNVKVFAHIGDRYHSSIYDSDAYIKELDIMLRDMENLSTLQFPIDKTEKKECRKQTSIATKEIDRLRDEGNVSNLNIYKYPFDPSIHFIIAGGKMLFGIYWPSPKHPGARFLRFFIVGNESPGGKQLINDCEDYFNKVTKISRKT